MVLGVCRRILKNSADADDAFQATFLLLSMKAKVIRDPEFLGNWLYGVATRIAVSLRRSRQRQQSRERSFMNFFRGLKTPRYQDVDLKLTLDEQVAKLPDKLRAAVVCCYVQGFTKREAARKLNCPDSTVTFRLKQARELLRRRLEASDAMVSEKSLASLLVPVAVSMSLLSSTSKAATAVVSSGKLAAGGAASGKAVGLAKSTHKALFAGKLKLTASLVLATTLMSTGAAVTTTTLRQSSLTSNASPSTRPTTPATQPVTHVTVIGGPNRFTRINVDLINYASQHGFPADLKELNYKADDIDYVGIKGVQYDLLRNPDSVALIAQKPVEGYDGPIVVGFASGRVAMSAQASAQQHLERARAAMKIAATGQVADLKYPTSPPLTQHASVALPPEVRAALTQNASRLSPLAITLTKVGQSALPMKQAMATYYIPRVFFDPYRAKIIWQDGKRYAWGELSDGSVREAAFDGEIITLAHGPPHPELLRQPLSKLPPRSMVFAAGFLENVGTHLPVTAAEVRAGKAVPEIPQNLHLGMTLTSVGADAIDNRPMTRLTLIGPNPDWVGLNTLPTERTYISYLDPALNYAVRRSEERYGDTLLMRIDHEKFQDVGSRGVWLPLKSTTAYYFTNMLPERHYSEPILFEVSEVTELSGEPVPEKQFVLQSAPGGKVFDRTVDNHADASSRPEAGAHADASDHADAGGQAGAGQAVQAASQGVLAHVPAADSKRLFAKAWIMVLACALGGIVFTSFGLGRYRRAATLG